MLQQGNNMKIQRKTQATCAGKPRKVQLVSIGASKNRVHLKLRIANANCSVEHIAIRHRSRTDADQFYISFKVVKSQQEIVIKAQFTPSSHVFREVYWDPIVTVRTADGSMELPVTIPALQRRLLYVRNLQWHCSSAKILFANLSKGSTLSFVYRDYNPKHDTHSLRVKELAAVGAYKAARSYWEKKRIWLVYEKFCSLAQDNGFYFFEYCMSLPADERKHIYYVIDKSQHDYENVRKYEDNVVDFMSLKHLLYSLAARIYIGSDSVAHLYLWRPKPSIVRHLMSKHDSLFLQHGVTAMKRVDHLYGAAGSSPATYFLATSKKEQQIVVDNFGYEEDKAPILGFARWDKLEDRSSKTRPAILLMPTWRPWLEEQDDEVFVASEYYRTYASLIQNEALAEVLDEYDATLLFFIHPKLRDHLSSFSSSSGRIQLVPQGSKQLNTLMMECNMLITDYSSVCWDMLFMDKPVAYYQFDQELYEQVVGSYVDLNADLPGKVCFDEQTLVETIRDCASCGFALSDDYKRKASQWLEFRDKSNCKRIFDFLVESGY